MANKPPLTVRSVVRGIKSATQLIAESTKEVVTEVMPNTTQTLSSAHTEASNTLNQTLNRISSNMDKHSNVVARTKLGRKIQNALYVTDTVGSTTSKNNILDLSKSLKGLNYFFILQSV